MPPFFQSFTLTIFFFCLVTKYLNYKDFNDMWHFILKVLDRLNLMVWQNILTTVTSFFQSVHIQTKKFRGLQRKSK